MMERTWNPVAWLVVGSLYGHIHLSQSYFLECGLTVNDNATMYNLTLNVSLLWLWFDWVYVSIIDESNNIILETNTTNASSILQTVCVSDGCYELDSQWGDQEIYGTYSLLFDDSLIAKQYVYANPSFYPILACTKFFANRTNMLNITYNFQNYIQISNVTKAGSSIDDYNIDVIYQSHLAEFNTHSELNITNGCYLITVYDSPKDNDLKSDNNNNDISFTNHGSWQARMNEDIFAYAGYFYDSQSFMVCSDKNHVNYCIVPGYCDNNNNIFMTDYESDANDNYLFLSSYRSLVNSSYDKSGVKCFGANSCQSSILNQSDSIVACYGTDSCLDTQLFVNTVHCFGTHSCAGSRVRNTTDFYLYVLSLLFEYPCAKKRILFCLYVLFVVFLLNLFYANTGEVCKVVIISLLMEMFLH